MYGPRETDQKSSLPLMSCELSRLLSQLSKSKVLPVKKRICDNCLLPQPPTGGKIIKNRLQMLIL
jgi:hypothetical protein